MDAILRIRITKHELRSMVFIALSIILNSLFIIHPVYADVKIGETFGFRGPEFNSLGGVVSKIVPAMFSIATACVVLYFLFGAFKFIQSRGNKEEVAAAQNIIIHSVIGFIILMFCFLILQFVLSSLFKVEGFRIIG